MDKTEVIKKAAALIEEKGFIQGILWRNYAEGPYCMRGAVLKTLGKQLRLDQALQDTEFVAVDDILRESLVACGEKARIHTVAIWNNKSGRTKKEVVDFMRCVAENTENGG